MSVADPQAALRILVIRRENIGDLVCTTPLLRALRQRFPNARIETLVNSYNAAVLNRHPDVDEVHVYTKLKHRAAGQSRWAIIGGYIALLWRLRRRRFDYMVVVGHGGTHRTVALARKLRPRHIVAFANSQGQVLRGVDLPVAADKLPLHEVENMYRLLTPFGIRSKPPAMCVVADPAEHQRAAASIEARAGASGRPRIAVHISARKPSNRWIEARVIELIRRIHDAEKAVFVLFWSPGAADNALHPGDDAKARTILQGLADVPIVGYPTDQLAQLIGGLSACDRVICSDGGAMHLAAALGKPILCFFGKSEATHWYPWGVPHVLLQPPSREVGDISVDQAFAAYQQLVRSPAPANVAS
ncbi:MAG: glycosyltransferase family 9 protein [Gammaproteobacteria bacterium]|nr:glycosyltransferase family 9 protein [Gammaproteobacteria bacterium]